MKLPANTEFQIQNEARDITITDINEGNELSVAVEYGLLVSTADDDAGKIKGSRYHCAFTLNILGKDSVFSGVGVDFQKAFAAMCVSFNRTEDEFELPADIEEDEFFAQKYKAATVGKDDIWNHADYKDKVEQLEQLRGATEDAIAKARDGEKGTQDDYLQLARVIKTAYELVGKSRKALLKWAEGSGKGENLTLLTQLGSGQNALTEAMRLAQITDHEYSVLPASVTSGKGLDTHGRVSIKQIVTDAQVEKVYAKLDVTGERPDADGVEVLLRKIAEGACNIENALAVDESNVYIMDLSEITERVNAFCAEQIVEFREAFGKNVSTYVKPQYEAAKTAYALARMSTGGADIYGSAVSALVAYDAMDEDDAEGKKKILDSLFLKTAGNALLKEAYNQVREHAAGVARDDKMRAAKTAAADVDDKKAVSASWADLDPAVAAQWLNTRIAKHGKPNEVAAALRGLLSGHALPAAAPVAQAAE